MALNERLDRSKVHREINSYILETRQEMNCYMTDRTGEQSNSLIYGPHLHFTGKIRTSTQRTSSLVNQSFIRAWLMLV